MKTGKIFSESKANLVLQQRILRNSYATKSGRWISYGQDPVTGKFIVIVLIQKQGNVRF